MKKTMILKPLGAASEIRFLMGAKCGEEKNGMAISSNRSGYVLEKEDALDLAKMIIKYYEVKS